MEKDILIQNTSSATIFQLSDMVFDIYLKLNNFSSQSNKAKKKLKKYFNKKEQLMDIEQNIAILIFDFVEISKLQKPQWLKKLPIESF